LKRYSNQHANSPRLLGLPRDESGEKIHLQKIFDLLKECKLSPTISDLEELIPYDINKFGFANFALIESKQNPIIFPHTLDIPEEEIWTVAHAVGIAAARGLSFNAQKRLIYKFQVHHRQERVNTLLYYPAHYLFTESLLAHIKGEEVGMNVGKMVYIPHFASSSLPERNITPHVKIGMCSRFDQRKNVHCVLQVLEKLALKGKEFEFVLIGALPAERLPYDLGIEKALKHFSQYSWFKWIDRPLTHQETLCEFATFSFAVHPSGAEAGSHTVVEYLSLGIPTILPRCTTFPYMFADGVYFIDVEPKAQGQDLMYFRPDLVDLERAIEEFIDSSDLRNTYREHALRVSQSRFTKEKAQEKLLLLLKGPSPKECIECFYSEKELYGL
jgi:glycosyltransferase involved in cell wall biosynthesis